MLEMKNFPEPDSDTRKIGIIRDLVSQILLLGLC